MDLYLNHETLTLPDMIVRRTLSRATPTYSGLNLLIDLSMCTPTPPNWIQIETFILPLTGVKNVLQTPLRMIYYAQSDMAGVYGAISILILKADGTQRREIAQRACKSSPWQTAIDAYQGADYVIPQYAIEDETDYLAVTVEANVPAVGSPGQYMCIRIDDVNCTLTQRMRLSGVVLASLKDAIVGIVNAARLANAILPNNLDPTGLLNVELEE